MFIGFDDALKHTDKPAICFSPSENGLCAVTVNGTRSYNDTIREVPDDVLQRILNNDGNIAECSQAYDSLLRRAHLSYIEEHYSKAIRDEYEKFVSAIEDARISARDYPDVPEAIKYLESGIDDDFTFHEGRSIINCAEIWATREMILHGVKFEDIKLSTRLRNSNAQLNGSIFPPCGNCKNVFWRIRSNVDGYK